LYGFKPDFKKDLFEIGMQDVPIPPQEVQDPQGLNMPDKNLSRDPARTPMQWDTSEKPPRTRLETSARELRQAVRLISSKLHPAQKLALINITSVFCLFHNR
jgi:glycosidase